MVKFNYVCLIGRPNSGKSTLLNNLVKKKVSIVTNKINTTVNNVLGVINDYKKQLFLIDTPGIVKLTKIKVEKKLVQKTFNEIKFTSIICILLDVTNNNLDDTLLKFVKYVKLPLTVLILLNKIDLLKQKSKLLLMISAIRKIGFENVFLISSKKIKT